MARYNAKRLIDMETAAWGWWVVGPDGRPAFGHALPQDEAERLAREFSTIAEKRADPPAEGASP